jgi:hypothetical protein
MKTKNRTSALILSGFFLVICVVCYQLFVHKCLWWECAPNRKFNVYDIALPDTFFPTSAKVYPLHEERGIINAVEEGISTVDWKNGLAVYKILRFATEKQASKWYKTEVGLNLFTSNLQELENYPSILSYQSNVAEEFYSDCGYVLKDARCIYWARYDEFFIFFSGSIGENEMSDRDFLGAMNYIDAKIGELLKSEK